MGENVTPISRSRTVQGRVISLQEGGGVGTSVASVRLAWTKSDPYACTLEVFPGDPASVEVTFAVSLLEDAKATKHVKHGLGEVSVLDNGSDNLFFLTKFDNFFLAVPTAWVTQQLRAWNDIFVPRGAKAKIDAWEHDDELLKLLNLGN